MKKVLLFLMLIISSLALAGSLPAKKEKVVLTGKMIFKYGKYTPIKFYMKDIGKGNYSLVLYQENKGDADFLIKSGVIINNILKERIDSTICTNQLRIEKDTNFLFINFSNKEVEDMNKIEIFFLGFKLVSKIEKNLNCEIYPT